jgi:hypothetical protein
MSYEGYEQVLCENGHLSVVDAYNDLQMFLCSCGAKAAWSNSVDQTNCEEVGLINMERLLVREAKYETCDKCKHSKLVFAPVYRIPGEHETKALQTREVISSSGEIETRYILSNKLVKTRKFHA